jgi:hypothetical protein
VTERQLRYRSGVFLIILHVFVLLSIVLLRFLGGFEKQEFTTLMGVVMPMFSGYTSAIITFIVKDRHVLVDTSQKVTGVYAGLLFGLPTLLVVVISTAIWLQAYKRAFENFEDFKTFVMAFESAFAVYVSVVVYALFEPKALTPQKQQKNP